MARLLLVVLCGSLLSGCTIVTRTYFPGADLQQPVPHLTPSIIVKSEAFHDVNGYFEYENDSVYVDYWFDRVRRNYPFLKNALLNPKNPPAAPEYILNLQSRTSESGVISAIVCGLTLTLVPCFFESDITIDASLTSQDGNAVISRRSAIRKSKATREFFLIFYAPFNDIDETNQKLHDELYTDVLNQVSNDYKDYLGKNPPKTEPQPPPQPLSVTPAIAR